MSDSRKGRRSGKSVHQDSRPRPEKVVNGETEFKLGDSVIFNIRSADNPEKVVAITVADGVFKKQKLVFRWRDPSFSTKSHLLIG